MPVWHEALQGWQERGEVQLVGVIQEQHAERCRLFAQWKEFDWPILHDPINLLGLRAVPVMVAIDEHGVVRETRPRMERFVEEFVQNEFKTPNDLTQQRRKAGHSVGGELFAGSTRAGDRSAEWDRLRQSAYNSDSASTWTSYGDALILWGKLNDAQEAAHAYRRALAKNPQSAALHFRLGVAERMQFEHQLLRAAAEPVTAALLRREFAPSGGANRSQSTFQAAVESWQAALEIDPNHYIYRRRIQQYGPRLIKPYPFYDWVEQARREINERGLAPLALPVEPSGAEIATPARSFSTSPATDDAAPDPSGAIQRDTGELIAVSSVVVPAKVKPGEDVRVHLDFIPAGGAHWNNEAEPLEVWVEPPPGWQIQRRLLRAAQPTAAESRERRQLEFELKVAPDTKGTVAVSTYALYYVCEEEGGTCLFLRQDLPVAVAVSGDP